MKKFFLLCAITAIASGFFQQFSGHFFYHSEERLIKNDGGSDWRGLNRSLLAKYGLSLLEQRGVRYEELDVPVSGEGKKRSEDETKSYRFSIQYAFSPVILNKVGPQAPFQLLDFRSEESLRSYCRDRGLRVILRDGHAAVAESGG